MPKRTVRAFDEMCRTPVAEMAPEAIRALRLREHASQAAFARCLNVATGPESQRERGEKRPRGASPKLDAGGEERSRDGRARPAVGSAAALRSRRSANEAIGAALAAPRPIG